MGPVTCKLHPVSAIKSGHDKALIREGTLNPTGYTRRLDEIVTLFHFIAN